MMARWPTFWSILMAKRNKSWNIWDPFLSLVYKLQSDTDLELLFSKLNELNQYLCELMISIHISELTSAKILVPGTRVGSWVGTWYPTRVPVMKTPRRVPDNKTVAIRFTNFVNQVFIAWNLPQTTILQMSEPLSYCILSQWCYVYPTETLLADRFRWKQRHWHYPLFLYEKKVNDS